MSEVFLNSVALPSFSIGTFVAKGTLGGLFYAQIEPFSREYSKYLENSINLLSTELRKMERIDSSSYTTFSEINSLCDQILLKKEKKQKKEFICRVIQKEYDLYQALGDKERPSYKKAYDLLQAPYRKFLKKTMDDYEVEIICNTEVVRKFIEGGFLVVTFFEALDLFSYFLKKGGVN